MCVALLCVYLPAEEGDEAVQDLVFLNQRTTSKLSASLVASGPAGKHAAVIVSMNYTVSLFVRRIHTLLELLQCLEADGLLSCSEFVKHCTV